MEKQQSSQIISLQEKPLRLMLASPLIQTYQYTFPNEERVNLKIACIKDVKLQAMEGIYGDSIIKVEQIQDWQNYLRFLSIRKRLNGINIGQGVNDSLLNGFDAVKCTNASKLYIIFTTTITRSLCSFVHQVQIKPQAKLKIRSEYGQIMNDLYENQIIFGHNFKLQSLRFTLKPSKPVIRVNRQFTTTHPQSYFTAEVHKNEQLVNPYEKNVEQTKRLFNDAFIIEPQIQKHEPLPENDLLRITQIFNHTKLLSEMENKTFIQVQNQIDLKVLHSSSFLQDLYCHYRSDGRLADISRFIAYKKTFHTEMVKKNPIHLPQLDRCIQIQTYMKIQEKKYQAISKNYLQSLKKLYYNPLRTQPSQKNHSFITSNEISKALQKLKPTSKINKCHYHFLKAKQAWLNLNFYRSLAHLQKAMLYTINFNYLSKIHLQMGRMWSHLCDFKKAEKEFYTSLAYIQQQQGCESIHVLSPLQNLIILYSKNGNIKKSAEITVKCESIKKRYGNTHLRLMPNLIHSISTPIIFGTNSIDSSGYKQSKLISKNDIIKMQIQRIPLLGELWQIVHPFMQKAFKDEKMLQQNSSIFQFGEFRVLYFIIRLIICSQVESNIDTYQLEYLQSVIEQTKQSNIRMYYRLIFLFSLYLEKNNQIIQAVQNLRILYESSFYSLAINNTFRKRILQLAKKAELKEQLKLVYSDIDWLSNEGMMEQLFNSAVFFQSHDNHLQSIKCCNRYIKSIKQYATPIELRKNSKLIDRTQKVQIILIRSLIQLQLFTQAYSQMKKMSQNKKIDKKDVNCLAVAFCIKTFKSMEYSFCIEVYKELISFQCLLEYEPKVKKYIWLVVVQSITISNSSSENMGESLITLYQNLAQFHQEIASTNLRQRIKQLAKRKPQWTNFSIKINQFTVILRPQEVSDKLSTIQFQIQKCCESYITQKAKNILKKLRNECQTKSQAEMVHSIQHILDLIVKMSVLKGHNSNTIVFLHALLFEAYSCADFLEGQVLLLLWFTSQSHKLIAVWEEEMWGGMQARELLLDRLLSQLFKTETTPNQQKNIDKLWWVATKRKDLIKLWTSYRKITTFDDEPTIDIVITFRILYGSYFSQDWQQSSLLKDVAEKSSISFDDDECI